MVSPAGTRNRIARGVPAASRRAISSVDECNTSGRRSIRRPRLPPPAASPATPGSCSSSSRRGRRDQPVDRRAVAVEALRLEVRRVRPADVGPFVPVEAQPAQAVDDAGHHVPRRALGVRVFDAQHERAAVPPGVQPVEQRRPGAADVQVAGRRRGEPDSPSVADRSFLDTLEDLSEGRPELLACLRQQRALAPRLEVRRRVDAEVLIEVLKEAAARSRLVTATLSSSFSSSDRLSKLADPNMLQMPSTTNILVCIIVG